MGTVNVEENLRRHFSLFVGNDCTVQQQQQQQRRRSDQDVSTPGQGFEDQLAETESRGRELTNEHKEHAASITVLMDSALRRLTSVEEQQRSLCKRLDTMGLWNPTPVDKELLESTLRELGQRVCALEDVGDGLSLDTAAQLQVALGAIDDHVSGGSGLSSARGGSCSMTLPTRFCEMATLADSLTSDLHNARLLSDSEMTSSGHFSMRGEEK